MRTTGESTREPKEDQRAKEHHEFVYDREKYDYLRVQTQELKAIEDNILNPNSVDQKESEGYEICSTDIRVTGHKHICLMRRDKRIGDEIRRQAHERANGKGISTRGPNQRVAMSPEAQQQLMLSRHGNVERAAPMSLDQLGSALPDARVVAQRDAVHSKILETPGLVDALLDKAIGAKE